MPTIVMKYILLLRVKILQKVAVAMLKKQNISECNNYVAITLPENLIGNDLFML